MFFCGLRFIWLCQCTVYVNIYCIFCYENLRTKQTQNICTKISLSCSSVPGLDVWYQNPVFYKVVIGNHVCSFLQWIRSHCLTNIMFTFCKEEFMRSCHVKCHRPLRLYQEGCNQAVNGLTVGKQSELLWFISIMSQTGELLCTLKIMPCK